MLPPCRWALLWQGVYWLALRLIALDEHARPVGEDNDRFGLGLLILGAWLFAGVVGLLLSMMRLPAECDRSRAALWPVPVGMLVAVLFLHWLSNRLAGATPALLVHATVFGVALGIAAVIWKGRSRVGTRQDLAHLAVVAAVTVSALVAWAALEAAYWGARAREIANDAPYFPADVRRPGPSAPCGERAQTLVADLTKRRSQRLRRCTLAGGHRP